MSLTDIRVVLRALAEVRDGDFYSLWVLLTRTWPHPLPEIEFRIYKVADSADAHVVVHVTGTRPDGVEFDWGLTVTTQQGTLIIEGSVDSRADSDGSEMFRRHEKASDSEQAASIIRTIASEVCSQREWLTAPPRHDKAGP